MEHGSVTHDGKRYDLGRLLQIAESRPLDSVGVHYLSWIIGQLTNPCGSCKHGPETWHEERIDTADLACPILVLSEGNVGYVIDGLHRLIQANRKAVRRLPCKWVYPPDMELARVNDEVSSV